MQRLDWQSGAVLVDSKGAKRGGDMRPRLPTYSAQTLAGHSPEICAKIAILSTGTKLDKTGISCLGILRKISTITESR